MSKARAKRPPRRCRNCGRVLLVLDHAGEDPLCGDCSRLEYQDSMTWDGDPDDLAAVREELEAARWLIGW